MFKVGESLYIERENDNGQVERYKTVLVQYSDQEIMVEFPIHEESKKIAFFEVGESFECVVYQGGKVNTFATTYVERKNEKIPIMVLTFPGKNHVKVIQRRQHVRVEANLDTAVHPEGESFNPFNTLTLDISGGGCAILITNEQERQIQGIKTVILWIVLHLDGKIHYIKTKASPVRFFETSTQRVATFRFAELSNTDRMQIIRYCFQREVQLSRK